MRPAVLHYRSDLPPKKMSARLTTAVTHGRLRGAGGADTGDDLSAPYCEARDCDIVKCLDEETGITEITCYRSHCERHWIQFEKGDKWML